MTTGGASLRWLVSVAVMLALTTTQAQVPALDTPDGGSETGETLKDGQNGDAPDAGVLSECDQATADHSVVGCDYWAFSPNRLYEFGCGAVLLSNVSTNAAEIAVTYKGNPLDPTQFMQLIQGSGPSVSYVPLSKPIIPSGQTAFVALFRGQGTWNGTPGLGCPISTPIHG